MGPFEEALLCVLEFLICPRCKRIFRTPVTLDCGHSVCFLCALQIRRKKWKGQRYCCCPKCGEESLTEYVWPKVNRTLCEVATVAYVCTLFRLTSWCIPQVGSDGDKVGDILGFFYFGRYFSMSLCKYKLAMKDALISSRRLRTDLITQAISVVTQESVSTLLLYKTQWYKWAFVAVLEPLTCPHCEEEFTRPLTLDCGHCVCWDCVTKIGSENEEGQRCYCCPKCEAESVTEHVCSTFNPTLFEAAAVAHGYAASLGKGRSNSEVINAGDSGVVDRRSEYFFGASRSIASMKPPPYMLSKGDLFNSMFLLTHDLESEDGREQRSVNKASLRRAFSLYGRSKGLFEPEPPEQSAPASSAAHWRDLVKQTIAGGTQESEYKTTGYQRTLVPVIDQFICLHCECLSVWFLILQCGHNICWECYKKDRKGREYEWCPKRKTKSVTKDFRSRVKRTLREVTDVALGPVASLGKLRRIPEVRSVGDIGSE